MPKLKNFSEAKRKFKTDEDAIKYFILVDHYEEHLKGEQKEAFLNAGTIDDMLNVLNEKQLKYLGSVVEHNHTNPEWWKKYGFEAAPDSFSLFKELLAEINEKAKEKVDIADLASKYKSRLKNFDGDSIEYRQWLIVLEYLRSIPFIERIYDVDKLLKRLNLTHLGNLKRHVAELLNTDEKSLIYLIGRMKYREPYLYYLATKRYEFNKEASFLDVYLYHETGKEVFIEGSGQYGAFEMAAKRLLERVNKAIAEKQSEIKVIIRKFMKDNVQVVQKIGISKTFDKDMAEIARLVGGEDEVFLKNAIARYCATGVNGDSSYNYFLRKAVFLRKLSDRGFEVDDMIKFSEDIGKVAKYLEDHLISKSYTVYRGMKIDGLEALLDKSSPKISYKTGEKHKLKVDEDLMDQINRKKPIVFDEGLTSTSLNESVSAVRFGGRNPGNVFFTIHIPGGSKALVLDYEEIENVPTEEEVLLAPRTKIRINKIKEVGEHYEIDAEVVN